MPETQGLSRAPSLRNRGIPKGRGVLPWQAPGLGELFLHQQQCRADFPPDGAEAFDIAGRGGRLCAKRPLDEPVGDLQCVEHLKEDVSLPEGGLVPRSLASSGWERLVCHGSHRGDEDGWRDARTCDACIAQRIDPEMIRSAARGHPFTEQAGRLGLFMTRRHHAGRSGRSLRSAISVLSSADRDEYCRALVFWFDWHS